MDLLMLCIPAVVIFIASFFATVTGFGFGLIAMPLLSFVMSAKAAVICVLITTVLLRIITMYNTRKDFSWIIVVTTVLGSSVGVLPGSYVLKVISVEHLKVFLGVVLLIAVFLMGRQYNLQVKNKTLGRLIAGFFSGFFGASTSVSGPPIIIYFLNEDLDKVALRANMGWIFGLSFIGMITVTFFMGNLSNITDWNILLPMLPAILIGIILGEKFFHKIDQALFKKIVLMIVCAGAVMMLFTGIRDVL